MDLSVVVVCFDKKVFPVEIEKNIKEINANSEVVYITSENNTLNTNEKVYYFNEKNEDKAINSIVKLLNGKSILLIRENYNLKNFNKIEEIITSKEKADILLFNKKRNKFNNFCFKYLNKLNNLLFSYKLYDGDISIMLFNQNPTTILKVLDNPSVFMKINKWLGMSIAYLENKNLNYYKPNINIIKEIACISSFAFVFVLSIVLWASVKYFHTFLFAMIFLLLMLLSFGLSAIWGLRLLNTLEVGRIENEKLNIIESKEIENGED